MSFYRTITIWLLTLALINHVNGQSSSLARKPFARVDTLIQRLCTTFAQQAPFASLSVGVIDQSVVRFYNFGTTLPGQRQRPAETTIYEIGSITKTFTGTLLAQAVIDGRVKLDDDIRRYITDDYPNLAYQNQPIRLVHLLNHSSGLPFGLPFRPAQFVTSADSVTFEQRRQVYTAQEFFNDLHQVKLDTVPGIKLSYSNAAAQLLGYILERVYKKSYSDLLRQYITRPLGMVSTTTAIHPKQGALQGYNSQGNPMPYFLRQEVAAGGIYSTTADLMRYAQWQMTESDPVVKLTHQPTWGDIRYYAMGLNWQMDHKAPAPRRLFQSGGTAGFSSCLLVYPDQKRGIVLLTNFAGTDTQGRLSTMAKEVLAILAL